MCLRSSAPHCPKLTVSGSRLLVGGGGDGDGNDDGDGGDNDGDDGDKDDKDDKDKPIKDGGSTAGLPPCNKPKDQRSN